MIGSHPNHRLDVPAEGLITKMDACRVAASLTLSTIGIFHSFTQGNEISLLAAKANNRLIPVATVNPKTYFGAGDDLSALRAKGFRAIRFFPDEQGWTIDSAAFAAVLKQLAPTKMPVLLETMRSGEPTSVARMVAQYPATVILCSVGLDVLSETLAVMADLPNTVVETHELHVPGALELIAERAGSDRIVFGSGAPRNSVMSSLQYVVSSQLSDEDKQRVLGSNIRRILEAI
jgi:predicted TIM-barrel fold metal-dependent hydrolase